MANIVPINNSLILVLIKGLGPTPGRPVGTAVFKFIIPQKTKNKHLQYERTPCIR